MVLRQKVILVDAEEMELWELKHPHKSFSSWVRQQIHRDVRPDVQPVGLTTNKPATAERCQLNPRYKGAKPTLEMCRGCGVLECELRVG